MRVPTEPVKEIAQKRPKPFAGDLFRQAYEDSIAAGWPDVPVPTRLMLVVSELAEAMEGDRKGLRDDHLPHRSMLEVELADAVIRIADLAGREGLDLVGAIQEKLAYNRKRQDHKKESRGKEGGKRY